MATGATSIAESADRFYGDCMAQVTCPFGNFWTIFIHVEVEDLTPDHIARPSPPSRGLVHQKTATAFPLPHAHRAHLTKETVSLLAPDTNYTVPVRSATKSCGERIAMPRNGCSASRSPSPLMI